MKCFLVIEVTARLAIDYDNANSVGFKIERQRRFIERDCNQCFSLTSTLLDALFQKARDKLLTQDLYCYDTCAEALTRLAHKVDVMTLAKISDHKGLRILQQMYYRKSSEDISSWRPSKNS